MSVPYARSHALPHARNIHVILLDKSRNILSSAQLASLPLPPLPLPTMYKYGETKQGRENDFPKGWGLLARFTLDGWKPLCFSPGGGGVLLGIFVRDVPTASSRPNFTLPTSVFRPGLKNRCPFSDLTLYVNKLSICISAERKLT